MSLRSLAERMSRGIKLRRRLPPGFGGGTVVVSTGSGGLRFWKRDMMKWDAGMFNFIDEFVKPGDTVWDVGANVGLFSFAAAHHAGPAGKVLAIEPDIDNVGLMLRSQRLLDVKTNAPVTILPAAVGSAVARIAEFQIAKRSRSCNALAGFGSSQAGGFGETRCVPLFSLDDLITTFSKPTLVKIDVEGAELVALEGGHRLMSEVRPIITVEVERDDDHQRKAAEFFKRYDYRMFDADTPKPDRVELTSPAWNCLAMPA